MTSVSLSEISYSIIKHHDRLKELVKGPQFEAEWVEKLTRSPKKPKSFTGNFAVTYHFKSKEHKGRSKDIGIRMWHSKVDDDVLNRYRMLSTEISGLNKASPNYIRFAPMELFEPSHYGFLVKGKRHPCLKMEWQHAENLDVFIDRIMKDPNLKSSQKKDLFRQIKLRILETGDILHTSKCSHGDLSSGNIMLSQMKDKSVKIHVIDFDSFYSDKLSKLLPSSIGHEDWQHPGYISNKINLFGLKSDYCSLLCLIITLEGLATDLSLYDQFSPPSQDGSGILIRKKDLLNPTNSPVLLKMLDSNQSLLVTYIDDLTTLLETHDSSKIKRPKSLSLGSGQKARPVVNAMIKNRKPIKNSKKSKPSWVLSKGIESEDDLINSLESGTTQTQIFKALSKKDFRKKFNNKSMFKFWEIVVQHFGGIENCEDDIQSQYIWAYSKLENEKSADLAEFLYKKNPSNVNIGQKVFDRLKYSKNWEELLKITTRAIDFSPTNINVNIFHSIAKLHVENLSVAEAFGDSRVRTNDDWRILCEIIQCCSLKKEHRDEELCLEVFPILMDSLEDKEVIRQVKRKGRILFLAIMNFLYLGANSAETNLDEFISLTSLSSIRMCKEIPKNWQNKVNSFMDSASRNPRYMKEIPPDEIYHLIEIISNLAIWGTGDPDKDLSSKLQQLIYSYELETSDGLPVAASFDTNFKIKDNDAMIVWFNGNWYFSKDRSIQWNSIIGNIWD